MFGNKNTELASALQETIDKSLAVSRENGELSEKNHQLTKEIREQENLIKDLQKEIKNLETDKATLLDYSCKMGIDLSSLLTSSPDLYKIYGINLIGACLNSNDIKKIIPAFDDASKTDHLIKFMEGIGLSLDNENDIQRARETYSYCRVFALSFFEKE